MSISYEEALSTLQAMFGEPWTRESLDLVLRHFQGHMENTVESILGHGDKDPQLLLDHLKNGGKDATALDEELARQLSSQVDSRPSRSSTSSGATNSSSAAPSSSSNNQRQLRGTPTTLPDDFLRVKTPSSTMDADEALARMLQDELFSEELRRNPDFAHLAGAGRRPQQQQQAVNRNSFTARGGPQQPMPPLPNIMEKLSEMGTSAKFKLTQMAEQFKQNTNRFTNQASGRGMGVDSPTGREMRGLLDRDDPYDAYELASRKDL